jgi:hypothetical protein
MKRVWLVVIGLGLFVLMVSNVYADRGWDGLIHCVCLDRSDFETRSAERALCNDDAKDLGYRHGVFRPFADRPYNTDLICQLCNIPCACEDQGDDWLFLCIGVGSSP